MNADQLSSLSLRNKVKAPPHPPISDELRANVESLGSALARASNGWAAIRDFAFKLRLRRAGAISESIGYTFACAAEAVSDWLDDSDRMEAA